MLEDKFVLLVKLLYDGTVKGNVQWEKTIKKGVYQTSFPESSIEISKMERDEFLMPSVLSSVYYVLWIYNKDNVLIEEVTSGSLSLKLGEGQSAFAMMEEIYLRARRMAERVEDTVDAILEQLGLPPDKIPSV